MRCLVVVGVCAAALVATAAASAKTPLPGIRSPSGNISCFVVPGGGSNLLCAIDRSSYSAALQRRCMKPDGSGVDWHGFELGARRTGQVLCTGGILYSPGTQVPRYRTLAYGRTWRSGAFTCVSRVTGLTCRNPAGHGLSLSRASWRTW